MPALNTPKIFIRTTLFIKGWFISSPIRVHSFGFSALKSEFLSGNSYLPIGSGLRKWMKIN
jgi:hypothetical protein